LLSSWSQLLVVENVDDDRPRPTTISSTTTRALVKVDQAIRKTNKDNRSNIWCIDPMDKSSRGRDPSSVTGLPLGLVMQPVSNSKIRVRSTFCELGGNLISHLLALTEDDTYLVWFHDRLHKLGNVDRQSFRSRSHGRYAKQVVADLGLQSRRSDDTSRVRERSLKQKAFLESYREAASDVDLLDLEGSKLFDFVELRSEVTLAENLVSLIHYQTNRPVFLSVPMARRQFSICNES